jgi:hypothetical protein
MVRVKPLLHFSHIKSYTGMVNLLFARLSWKDLEIIKGDRAREGKSPFPGKRLQALLIAPSCD